MWTLELLPEEGSGVDEMMMPPPPSTAATSQLSGTESQQAAKAAASKGPWVLTAGEFLLGRNTKARAGALCHIVLKDKSVSRHHARLTVRPLAPEEVTAVGSLQAVEITDLDSRQGTRVNDETKKLEPHVPRALKAGDVLKFPGARLRLRHQPMVLCPSNIPSAGKAELKAAAAKAGAHMANKWSPMCTHLVVVEEASATLKVAMAVLQGKPVVEMSWLTEGVLARREGKPALPLPDPARFPFTWKMTDDVVDVGRPRIGHFKGLRLVFVQSDETEELVRLAGGSVEPAYNWDTAQLADPEGTLASRRGAGVRATVLIDPEQAAKGPARALVEKLQRTPGVDAVSNKHHIASSIFSFKPMRDKDDAAIPLAPEAGPAASKPAAAESAAAVGAGDGAPPSTGKGGGAKGGSKASKAKAVAAAAAEEEAAEAEKEQAAAAAAAAVASPARTTRRSARAGADDATAAEGGEAALTTPGGGGGGSSSTRATRFRATPAAEAAPATAGSTTRKRGRAQEKEEGAEPVVSPGRRRRRPRSRSRGRRWR
jgi:hypothetical protein